MRMIATFLKLLAACIRGRALDLEVGRTRLWLHPDGTILPAIAGADGADDPDPEPTPDPEVEPDPDPTPEPDPDPEPDPEPDEFDKERAMRTIHKQRAEEKRLKAERDKIKAERDEMLREKETEQERTVRELGEAKAEAERHRNAARTATINIALRDAASEAGMDPKRIKRALKLVDRDEIEVDDEGQVTGAEEAIEAVLEEFPEFRASEPEPESDDEEKPKRTPGANPDRKRKPKEMSAEEARRLARDDRDTFNQLFDEGKIPASALKG